MRSNSSTLTILSAVNCDDFWSCAASRESEAIEHEEAVVLWTKRLMSLFCGEMSLMVGHTIDKTDDDCNIINAVHVYRHR